MSIAKPFNVTERDRANCRYGLDFTTNSLLTKEFRGGSSFSLSAYSLTNVLAAASEWTYSRPRGGGSSPYRLGDFVNNETLTDGYSAKTSAPLGGFSNGVIGLDSYKTRTISTSPGKTDSSALNVSLEGTSLLYTSFKCRWAGSDLYSQSWQALGMVGSDVIPINNILDINNGYYRLGLVVRGVSNWYLCVSSSTFKEINTNTERQTSAPRWICPNLMSNTRLIDEVLEHMNSHEEYYATAVPCIVKNAIISVSGLICTTKLQSDGEIYCVPEGKVFFYYINPSMFTDSVPVLLAITNEKGYDDVFVYAPPKCVAEIGNRIMAMDGCMNIYASTADKNYRAGMNIYGSHYLKTKLIGSSGGLRSDLIEALDLITTGKINPAVGITHIGGINAIVDTTLYLKKIPGSKKITYPQINLPLTAIEDFGKLAEKDPVFGELDESCKRHGGLWNPEAEKILLDHFKKF